MTTNGKSQTALFEVAEQPARTRKTKATERPDWESWHLKYRPQQLDDLIGQGHIKVALSNALEVGMIEGSYAFTGPSGCGKTTTARIMAMALNCQDSDGPTSEPCGECNACQSIARGNSLDVLELDAASHNGVDDVRELNQKVHLHPAGRYRVVIIDECHMLSTAAQNALLKTLEEPPAHAVFILCTTEPHKMLGTILGRCQQYQFRSPGKQTLAEHLLNIAEEEGIELDEAISTHMALASGGHVRNAIQLLGKAALDLPITAEKVSDIVGDISPKVLFQMLKALAGNEIVLPQEILSDLLEESKEPKTIITTLAAAFRDMLMVKAAPDADPKQLMSIKSSTLPIKNLGDLSKHWSSAQLNAVLKRLHQTEREIWGVGNPKVWLEVCLLNITPGYLSQLEKEGK